MSNVDDIFLIKQTQAGRREAFRFLVLRHQQSVFYLLRALIRDPAVVEELAQETFLRAYKALNTFQPERDPRFSTWLFTIARNLAFNESAKRKVRREKNGLLQDEPEAAESGAEEMLIRRENAALLQDAMLRLPEPYRAAVALSYLSEISTAEIAAVEGCAEGTVKSRIHRGKKMLRDILAPLLNKKETK